MENNLVSFQNQGIVSFLFGEITTELNAKGEEKKKMNDLPPNWNKLTLETCEFTKGKSIAILTGKESNITALDFDDSDEYESMVHDFPELNKYKTIKTNKGFHIYFLYNPLLKTSVKVMNDYNNVDIRNDGGYVITYPTKYKLLSGEEVEYEDKGGDILEMPKYIFDFIKKDSKVKQVDNIDNESLSSASDNSDFEGESIKPKKTKKTKITNDSESDNINYGIDLNALVDLINVEYIDNRDSWTKIVWACKNCGIEKNKIIEISKKSSKYDNKGFELVYSGDYPKYTIGTLKHYGKLSDEEGYSKLYFFNVRQVSDKYLADVFYELYGENYIKQDGLIYVYHKGKWIKDEKKLILKYTIQTKLGELAKLQQKKDSARIEDHEKIIIYNKLYGKCFEKITSANGTNNIASSFECLISYEQSSGENVFDTKPYLFAFLNTGFDIQTGKKCVIKKEDYITQSTKYNYKEHTQDQYDLIKKLMEQIFPNEEIRKSYISVLYSGLIGQQFEYFIVANGCGRNGKGLINELFYSLLGNNYAYNLSVSVLTNPINDNGGTNQSLANMENKRWVISSEPDESRGTKLVMSSVKKITGDQILPARGIYSTKTEIQLTNTQAMECNDKLLFTGKIDQSVLNRIRDIPFQAHFTNDQSLWDDSKYIYPVNPQYKTSEFKKNHRIAFFHYIMDVVFNDILKSDKYEIKTNKEGQVINTIPYFPSIITERSKEYCFQSDILYTYIKENFEITENKDDFIKLKDLHNGFIISEEYLNMDKTDKVLYSYGAFTKKIKSNISIKHLYKTSQVCSGVQQKNILVGIKELVKECDTGS